MLSLGAFRYRDVLAEFGGPIVRLEGGPLLVRGTTWYQANATLRPELSLKPPAGLYAAVDGSGTHASPIVARHIAISEALERWAFYVSAIGEDRDRYGFDVEPSTTGMAAFPGLVARQARKRAYLEALERHCVRHWWEGTMNGELMDTDWPGVRAVILYPKSGGVTAITYSATPERTYCFGHAADESIGGAIERALVELSRHERVVRAWHETGRSGTIPEQAWERRALYFSTAEGFKTFIDRVETPGPAEAPEMEVLTDSEIPGPWSRYASVWRVTARPPSDRFYTDGDDYFLW
ncbi:MAG TPA: hypothetical protein VGL42_13860 [Opitutaceae bacterium]|jgi:hypothetical protein